MDWGLVSPCWSSPWSNGLKAQVELDEALSSARYLALIDQLDAAARLLPVGGANPGER